ncbi:MAG: alpha/beta fold hydrolase [Synechococcaceae cyanobacterium]|nr:alpha/beta fold hydrolase [Synechococcaceae cyanobacterium]
MSPAAAPLPEAEARLIDGPASAPATLLLAHGAGAPMDSPFMAAIAAGLALQGWRVVRFEFPYMARSRQTGRRGGPDRLPTLLQSFQAQICRAADRGPVFIGGKSLGGRVASLVLSELDSAAAPAPPGAERVRGGVCLGYPFHPPGKPDQLRTAHLASLRSPLLILQGERDSFGNRSEVEGYALSASVDVGWIPGGDHSFKPNRASGLDQAAAWALAIEATDRFLRRVLAT